VIAGQRSAELRPEVMLVSTRTQWPCGRAGVSERVTAAGEAHDTFRVAPKRAAAANGATQQNSARL